jgi:septal ring factor EnvC (AmiA/AmiB activator)
MKTGLACGSSAVALAFLLLHAPAACQTTRDLDQIRRDLEQARLQLRQQQVRERNLLDELAALEREIDLTRRLVTELRVTEERQRQRMHATEKQIAALEQRLERLQRAYARRVVSLYKYGRVRDLELLVRGISLHKVLVWLKLERMLVEQDQRLLRQLIESRQRLEAERKRLELQKAEQTQLLAEKSREEAELLRRKQERAAMLEKVRQDREAYARRVQELEAAAAEMRRLIGKDLEKQTSSPARSAVADFASLRGKLPWPVQGEVIQGFGRFKHPKFGTVVENLGIDIRAPMNAPVRAVAGGRISAITWQRARGNIVLMAHDGGYYTVYTHLADIYVNVGQEVEAGEVIGTVGDTGSLEGPKLHFEIWHNTENLNPELWLQ